MEPQEKILKKSLELFFKYGIKRVTMDDIAKELGMSKKTIYQYHKEKDDLVYQLCVVEMQKHQCTFRNIEKQSNDPIHEIVLISNTMSEMMQHINPIFFLDLQKFHPIAFQEFKTLKDNFALKDLQRNIKSGKELGVYRADVDEEFAAKYRLAQIDMLMFGNYFTYEKISFSQSHQLLLDMFVYGICTSKGYQLINEYKKMNH
jgi:AcrR family transcriptional regulator